MAYGLLCGAFYCINLLSEKDFEMVSPTIFYKRSLYLNLKLKAKAKQDDATRFTWYSAACSYQRLVDCQIQCLEILLLLFPAGTRFHRMEMSPPDAGDACTWVNDERRESHILRPGEWLLT